MNLLITGATGFLGKYLIKELVPLYEKVFILTRQNNCEFFLEYPNVEIVQGDITNLDVLFLNEELRSDFLSSIDHVLHAAALYDLSASYSSAYLQNIVGTQNMLKLMSTMPNLKAFYYISTIAVGDSETFFLEEDQFPKRKVFSDSYSETKFIAEQLVRNNQTKDYVTRIIRPGIIIGDSVTGIMPKVDGPYFFINAFKKYGHLLKYTPFIPLSFNPRAKLPIIPVDHCAKFIGLLIRKDNFLKAFKTYHLISSDCPSLSEFLKDLNIMVGIQTAYIPVRENKIHNSLLKLLGIPKEVLPFMFSKLSYDKTSTLEDLPEMNESTYSSFKHILFGKR
jgi:thioester reductase-like protein